MADAIADDFVEDLRLSQLGKRSGVRGSVNGRQSAGEKRKLRTSPMTLDGSCAMDPKHKDTSTAKYLGERCGDCQHKTSGHGREHRGQNVIRLG